MFDKGEDDEGVFLSAKIRDGNSSSRQSCWLLAMSNCFVLDAT